jgi:hypothetical protein
MKAFIDTPGLNPAITASARNESYAEEDGQDGNGLKGESADPKATALVGVDIGGPTYKFVPLFVVDPPTQSLTCDFSNPDLYAA